MRAAKRSIAQQLEQAKKNFEVGTASVTDTHEAQSRYDLASAQELAGENDLQVKQYALRVLVGKDVGALSRLRAEATLQPPQPASMEKWVEAAENDSFTVQAQQAAVEVAMESNMRAGHYPTLDGGSQFSTNQ